MERATRAFPVIETERLVLTLPPPEDAPRFAAYARENDEFWAPWSPPPLKERFTDEFWSDRLAMARADFEQDTAVRLALSSRADPSGPIVGDCNFTQIFRGPLQACYLGYKLDHRFVGKGLMFEALSAAIRYVFDELRLHRIMANYMPVNERSGRLLRRLGFVVEGYARDYLFIADAWQDHILTALTNEGEGGRREEEGGRREEGG
jgi:ribosomal-protein-alanine N-acetyltransferase